MQYAAGRSVNFMRGYLGVFYKDTSLDVGIVFTCRSVSCLCYK